MQSEPSYPLVTVGIQSFNRKNDLRETLSHLLHDQYPQLEILLLENASTDGTRVMLEEEFSTSRYPHLHIIMQEINIGIAGRNILFQEAHGKYLFSFDDDSYPSTPQLMIHAVEIMEADEHIAALCCSCVHPQTGYHETKGIERFASGGDATHGFDIINIAGGGTLFRMEDIRKTRGYDPDFFWGREENDLAFQLVHLGRRIVFYPQLVVHHHMSQVQRDMYARLTLQTRNSLWLLWKYFPFLFAIPVSLLFIVRRLLLCVKDCRRFKPVVSGVYQGISGCGKMRSKAQLFSVKQSWNLRHWFLKLLYE